jgi:opacity protein-like surface antigen
MRRKRLTRTLCLTSALLVGTTTAAAAQAGVSLWAGIGGSREAGVSTFAKDAKQLGAQLTVPLIPLALRADALLLGNNFDTDNLSYNVNAVAVMQLPLVQPYALAGRGKYVIAPNTPKESGWNYGAGVRLGVARLGAFVEMRRHDPLKRTIMTLGVTF